MRAGSRGVGPSEPPDAAARDATAQGISADHFTRPRLRPSMGQEMLLKRSSKNAPSAEHFVQQCVVRPPHAGSPVGFGRAGHQLSADVEQRSTVHSRGKPAAGRSSGRPPAGMSPPSTRSSFAESGRRQSRCRRGASRESLRAACRRSPRRAQTSIDERPGTKCFALSIINSNSWP